MLDEPSLLDGTHSRHRYAAVVDRTGTSSLPPSQSQGLFKLLETKYRSVEFAGCRFTPFRRRDLQVINVSDLILHGSHRIANQLVLSFQSIV